MNPSMVSEKRFVASALLFRFSKSISVFLLLIALVFGAVTPASSQIEVNKRDYARIQAGSEAAVLLAEKLAEVSKKIPNIGPFLKIATKLMFIETEGKSDEELQEMWQAYTNKQIALNRAKELRLEIDGFQAKIAKIDGLRKQEADPRTKLGIRPALKESKIRSWVQLESQIGQRFKRFKSFADEPATPLLHLLAGAAELWLLSVDRQIILQQDSGKTAEVIVLEGQRKDLIRVANETLKGEIEKAAGERAAMIKIETLLDTTFWTNYRKYWLVDEGHTDSDGKAAKRTVSRIYVGGSDRRRDGSEDEPKGVKDEGCSRGGPSKYDSGYKVGEHGCILGISIPSAKTFAERDLGAKRQQVFNNEVRRNSLHFLLEDYVNLAVDNLSMKLPNKTFRIWFSSRGGRVARGYWNGTDNSESALWYWLWDGSLPFEKQMAQIVNSEVGKQWKPTGNGYAQVKSYDAGRMFDFWNSPAGRKVMMGTPGYPETVIIENISRGLPMWEEKYWDPWERKLKWDRRDNRYWFVERMNKAVLSTPQ